MTLLGAKAHGSLVALSGAIYTLCIVVLVFCSITPKWQRANVVYDVDEATARTAATIEIDLGFWRICSQTLRIGFPTNTRCGAVTSCNAPFVNDAGLSTAEALARLGLTEQPRSPVPVNGCSAFEAARVFSVFTSALLLFLVLALKRWRIVPWPAIVAAAVGAFVGHCVVLGTYADNDFVPVAEGHYSLGYVYYLWVAVFVVSTANSCLHVWLVYAPQTEASKEEAAEMPQTRRAGGGRIETVATRNVSNYM